MLQLTECQVRQWFPVRYSTRHELAQLPCDGAA